MNTDRGILSQASAHAWSAEVYEHAIPDFVPAELERLYSNTFSSFLAEHVQESDTCTYVARTDGVVDTILLFKMVKRSIHVLNAAIHIVPEHVQRFTAFIFAYYPAIQAIGLVSVSSGALGDAYPCQRFRISEDYVLPLPSTVEAYRARLGKATVSGLRVKQNRLNREVPGASFQVLEGADIDDRMLDTIFHLKNEGRPGRGRLDREQQVWLRKVVRTHGVLGVTIVDGRVCAAALSTRIGSQLFLHVLAHDPAFDRFSLGTLNAYLAVCAGIRQGGRVFHLLWGTGVWKTRLGAAELQLENILVYRSRAACLACSDLAMRNLMAAHWRRLRLSMLSASRPDGRYAWLVRPCLNGWYRFKGGLA